MTSRAIFARPCKEELYTGKNRNVLTTTLSHEPWFVHARGRAGQIVRHVIRCILNPRERKGEATGDRGDIGVTGERAERGVRGVGAGG
jgi:hypothetical protein